MEKVGESLANKNLSEAVSQHQRCQNPVDFNVFGLCLLSNPMLLNVNVVHFHLYGGVLIIKYPNCL